jgi:hypothetical protein
LSQFVKTVCAELLSWEAWRASFSAVGRFLLAPWKWYRQNWPSVPGVVTTILFVLAAVGLYRARRSIAGWWRLRRRHDSPQGRALPRAQHDFVVRLERALARHGLVRATGQTHFEFAIAAGGELAESIDHIPLASLPRRVVEAFYRVRFGGRPLDNLEAKAVEQALCTLEDKL